MVVLIFIAKATIDPDCDRHRKTMIYDYSFFLQCVILRMKSYSAYVHIRKIRLLPLPSQSTMRRLLSSSKCQFGFNLLALEHICEPLKGSQASQRWVL